MPTAPNTSFIPKRGPVKRARQTASRQIHLFTIFSYVLFTATLVATVAVFFYSRYIDDLRRKEIAELDVAVSSFNDLEMKRVLEFDSRLRQARQRLIHTVSMSSIFDALEVATVQSARIARMEIAREGDSQFTIEAEIQAESFDSSLFQRGVFERNQIVDSVRVSDVELIGSADTAQGEESAVLSPLKGISFTANLTVPLSAVPYTGASNAMEEAVQTETVATSTATTTEVDIMSASDINL